MQTKALLLSLSLLPLVMTVRAADAPTAPPPIASPPRPRTFGVQPPARTFTNLTMMQEAYFNDFASKPGFGLSRVPMLPPQDFITLNGQTYRFTTPDLLGLEDEPIAYHRRDGELVSVAVLTKRELRGLMRSRALTAAESNAVAQLRAGQDIVTTPQFVAVQPQSTNRLVPGLLVVGALRAKANCAECHGVREGTLLGAFAYSLVPTNTASLLTTFLPTPDAPLTTSAPLPTTLLP